MSLRIHEFLLYAVLVCCSVRNVPLATGQPRQISGCVKDAVTGQAVPFPVISLEGDSSEYLGSMEGVFRIPLSRLPEREYLIKIRAYQYLNAEYKVSEGDSIPVQLHYAHNFTWQHLSLGKEKALITSLRKIRSEINPENEKNFSYQSYNKSVVTSSNIMGLKVYLDNLLRLVSKVRLGRYSMDHHIFLMESAAIRRFRRNSEQRETVISTQVSGISKPPPVSYISGFDALSIFEPYLRIGPKKYISPLAGRPLKRYAFSVIDSVNSPEGLILVVKFNPLFHRRKNLLQGILYVATNPPGIKAFQVWPAFDRESMFSLAQESMLIPSGRWFPKEIRTSFIRDQPGVVRIPLTAVSKTWISDFRYFQDDKASFDEVVFDFQQKNLSGDSVFPAGFRPEKLDSREQNTYRFYREAGSLAAIDRFLNLGQKLYVSRFPAGKFDVIFRDAIKFNDLEGLRIGLGLETNKALMNNFRAGGYLAYGLSDEQWKYGWSFTWLPRDHQSLTFSGKKDLSEPGIFPFAFDRRQYASGDLRNLRISRFDEVRSWSLTWDCRIFKNFNGRISVEAGRRNYLYNYKFSLMPEAIGAGFSEAGLQFCWNPGEQFARIENQLYPVFSPYPIFWFSYVRGISGILPQSFSFNRAEARVQWTRKILGLGDFGFRISAGSQTDNVPYSLLFSSRGSYRDFSLLSYNSFETMRYNEFFHSRFIHVFLTHRFGKMQISTLPFLPYFTLVHNMGWGILQNPEQHLGILAADTRKGFFETGLFLNDLFVIPLSGLDLGVGAGLFFRYGPYRLPSDFDNLVLKFSAGISF